MTIINWCLNKLFRYDGFHLMDEIYFYGLTLVFSVVMKVLVEILFTFHRVVWDIPVMRIIKWCLKKPFYYLRLSSEVLISIYVIIFDISLAENALEGTSTFLQILFAITLDNYPGRFKLVVYSTISYIFGALVLLLQDSNRNTNTKIPSFCRMLMLITVSAASNRAYLKMFLAEKVMPTREEKKERQQIRNHSWCLSAFSLVAVGIFLSLDRFMSHAKFCNRNDPMCDAIFEVLFVIQIAVLKINIVIETTGKQLLNSHKSSTRIAPRISWWLDKAPFASEEENRPGKPSTVAQVKEVKFCLGMVPMWTTFLIFSLVDATGSTYFLNQASNIDENFPVTVFIILVTVTSFAIDYLCDYLFRKIGNEMNGQLIMRWRIGVGMAFSFISFIFAYKNAVHWLDLVKIYTQPSMHMDIFSLTPQFLLLGIMKGLSERGLQSFFHSLLSESLRNYRTPFGECVMGIGKFLSTLCILLFKSWFGHDIDSSCLDNYYAILTVISFVNLLIFWVALANCSGDDQFSPQEVDCEQPIEGAQDSFGPSVLLSFSDQTPNNLHYISVSTRRTQSLPDMMPNNPPYISVSPRITRSFSALARLRTSNRLDDAHSQENEQLHIELFDCEHDVW